MQDESTATYTEAVELPVEAVEPQNTVGKGVRALQTVAGVIFFLSFALIVLRDTVLPYIVRSAESIDKAMSYIAVVTAFVNINFFAYFICIFIASNKANRVAAIMLTVTQALVLACDYLKFNYTSIICLILNLTQVYSLLLILRNNNLTPKVSSGVFFIILGFIASLPLEFFSALRVFKPELMDHWSEFQFYQNFFFIYGVVVVLFFMALGFWKLVHSSAYSGKIDNTTPVNYAPDTKGLVAFLISAALCFGLDFIFIR